MSGLKTTFGTREEILDAMKSSPPDGYFEWDGENEDERPLTKDELRLGIAEYRCSCGRSPVAASEPFPQSLFI